MFVVIDKVEGPESPSDVFIHFVHTTTNTWEDYHGLVWQHKTFFTLFLGLWDALNPYFSESLLTRSLLRVNLVIIS